MRGNQTQHSNTENDAEKEKEKENDNDNDVDDDNENDNDNERIVHDTSTIRQRIVQQHQQQQRKGWIKMFLRTDDPVLDYYNWDAEQAAELEKLPKCTECGEHIQDEYCYEINGELICERCLEDNHKHSVEDYME